MLRELGVHGNVHKQGDWVMSTCPVAPWRHDGGQDNSPSFGVHIAPHDVSISNCFTCGTKGPLAYLARLMEEYTGASYKSLIQALEDEDLIIAAMPEWDGIAEVGRRAALADPIEESMIDIYEPVPEDHPYLAERGLDNYEAVLAMELRIDPDSKDTERLLFPVRGLDGKLYGFSGRATNKESEPRVKDYFKLPKRQLILGAHLVNPALPVVVVEGLIDYAKMTCRGYQVVALLHSSLTPAQADVLKELGATLITLLDNDKAGRKGTKAIIKAMEGHVPVWTTTYPELEWDKESIDPEDLDPGILTVEEIDEMLENAELA